MSITVIDYGSGNLRSAAKALEVAVNNTNINEKIVVSSNPKVIKESKKIILPGQGSFRDCYLGIKKIIGLEDALNEFVLVATPEVNPKKFRATLSALKIDFALPLINATILPFLIFVPSFVLVLNDVFLSINLKAVLANLMPAIIAF